MSLPLSTGGTAGPGFYFIQIAKCIGPFGAITTEYHSVLLEAPATPAPALTAVNAPTWGQAFTMSLNSLANTGAPYIVAMSMSTNYGVSAAPGVHVGLDVDFLFLNLDVPDARPVALLRLPGNHRPGRRRHGFDQHSAAVRRLPAPPCPGRRDRARWRDPAEQRPPRHDPVVWSMLGPWSTPSTNPSVRVTTPEP